VAAARKPAKTRKGKVSRAGMGRRIIDPGPVSSKADRQEHVNQGAGPTKVGRNTPVRVRGPKSASVKGRSNDSRTDTGHAVTGSTIAEQANARADKMAAPKTGRAVRRRRGAR